MADSSVAITAGSGTAIDTRTNTTGEHRQVFVLGEHGDQVATLLVAGSKVPLDINIAASAGGVAATTGTFTNVANSAVTANVAMMGNATISLIGGTFAGLPIVFEASADGGTNWFGVDATQADGTGINTQITLPSNAGPRNWNISCPGYTHIRVRMTGTATTFTASPTVNINQGPMLWDPSPTVAPIDGQKATFSAYHTSSLNAASDLMTLQGSASKTIRITRVEIGFTANVAMTAGALVFLGKRSAANTGGTTAAATYGTYDSSDPARTGTAVGYTAAATALGAQTAVFGIQRFLAGTTLFERNWQWNFGGSRPAKCPVLRGANEYFVINLPQVVSGTSQVVGWNLFIEWTEE